MLWAKLHLALAVSGDNLLALTYNGLWTRPLSELTSVGTTSKDLPSSFGLDQNYPNTFNPTTTIRYTVGAVSGLPRAESRGQQTAVSRVRLAVYDLLGREVALLMDELKEPGRYEVKWDAGGCASGVYILRMTASDFVESKTMVLLK
jgi:hypothetical protein